MRIQAKDVKPQMTVTDGKRIYSNTFVQKLEGMDVWVVVCHPYELTHLEYYSTEQEAFDRCTEIEKEL